MRNSSVKEVKPNLFVVQDAVVIGGLDMQQQAKSLAKRPHVVVATPGRLRVSLSLLIHLRQKDDLMKPRNSKPSL